MSEGWEAHCDECGEVIVLAHLHTYWQAVEGYERKRDQGGSNHIALRRPKDRFVCNYCMKLLQRGVGVDQLQLPADA